MSTLQVFQVQGMSCQHCVKAIEHALRSLDAHAEVQIDLAQGRVEVRSSQPREALAQAIRAEGYDVAT
ncbi:Copper chaperone CopZ [Tepidimonas alkaliphilus]|uniref:Copper chaperone CopZ n=1 Tax=Tepidimonas alkaliphilus TaxID=2588942 RepID=A0A554W7V9_9BURK|nr:cation transporter [Tepidimonas alkaliphilus]TSE19663.1 Copper chaperone CopZ [Tepidimonas alkaliphilus]